nr:cation transporting ATPase C-terminal domain-containing protein [Candidatus Woesebacteria bacterium]
IGEIFAVLIGMMMGWPLILSPLQLLYINLVTDGLPAIVLAISAKRDGIMNRKPRQGKQMFDGMDMRWFIEVSVLTAITTLFAFWIGNNTGNLYIGRALAFTTIILVQHFILLDVWTRGHSVMRSGILSDKLFLFAFFAPLCIQPLLLYVPALSNIFKLYPLTSSHWLFVITLSLVVLIASEIRKIMLNRVHM